MAETHVLAIDIYGTILDTSSISLDLAEILGKGLQKSDADKICDTWRKYQLEYTWRQNSMGVYDPFDTVTQSALQHALAEHRVEYSSDHIKAVMEVYIRLQPFNGAREALEAISKLPNVKIVIFSNGTHEMVYTALQSAGLLGIADGIFLADMVKVYKPAKQIYRALVEYINSTEGRLAGVSVTPDRVWLVSGNPFDVAGARIAGFQAFWIDRLGLGWQDRAGTLKPTKVVSSLREIAEVVGQGLDN